MDGIGRPRDPRIDDAVLEATVDVLSQVGYAQLTMEAVARHARRTKPSIYRRWSNRQELVLAALIRRLDPGTLRPPDSGCVVCDLAEGVGVFVTAYRRMPPGALAALLAECTGPDRTAFMAKLFEPPRTLVGTVVDRARARGDLRDDLDRDLVVDLLGSLVYYRALFNHAPTDAETAVKTLLRGMAADYGELAGRELDHDHGLTSR
jgi:AcrR family transcriptional regulator